MAKLGIALDLGTSGFRAQAIDLEQDGQILSTAVTSRHPLPGANVIDHLHFALEIGVSPDPRSHCSRHQQGNQITSELTRLG